ncbi:hypothetical protein QZH41_001374 [Actinostola sp. cb2023]|nr:hypothetical protein QZH41_001374 [Actinostola sp. cb2023]
MLSKVLDIDRKFFQKQRKKYRWMILVFGRSSISIADILKDVGIDPHVHVGDPLNAEETKLTTDASPVGLGAVLTQVQNGTERVVAYASQSLTGVEQSRYFEVDVLRSTSAPKIIESLDKIFCTHGLPVTLRTDNGPQFVSEQFESYLAENGISHKTSTSLWPQANGEVERQNRSILKILKIAQSEKKDMQAELRKFLMAYRTTQHSSTGSTLAKLLFNREMKSKLPQLGDSPSTHMHTEAREKDSETKQNRADYADAKRWAKENDIAPVDRVLLKQRKEKKLSTTFRDEQYEVASTCGSEVVVTSPEGVDYRRNVTEVKKYFKDSEGQDLTSKTALGPLTSNEEKYNTNGELPSVPTRPVRERRSPEHLKDYVSSK